MHACNSNTEGLEEQNQTKSKPKQAGAEESGAFLPPRFLPKRSQWSGLWPVDLRDTEAPNPKSLRALQTKC